MTKRTRPIPFCLLLIISSLQSGCALISEDSAARVSVDLEDTWDEADNLNGKGIKHFQNGKPDLAEVKFQRAIQINGRHGGAHNNLGLLRFRRRHLALAAAEFEKAMQLMPNNPSPVNNLGMTLEEAGQYNEAINWYQQAHEMRPTSPLFLGNLIRAKMRAGYRDDLIKDQLRELLMHDTRRSWIEWAEEQLNLDLDTEDEHIHTNSEPVDSPFLPEFGTLNPAPGLFPPRPYSSDAAIEEWKPAPARTRTLDFAPPSGNQN